jgi:hypothetical protein
MSDTPDEKPDRKPAPRDDAAPAAPGGKAGKTPPAETGGPPGPEPTRFGDWEKNGRCVDF